MWAFYVHYSSLPVAHLQVLVGSSVIIEKADWSFRFGNLPTGTVFAQRSLFILISVEERKILDLTDLMLK